MIAGKLNSFDRKILAVAVLFLLLFSYLLFDDHLIMGWVSAQGPKVAVIIKAKDDVRLKFAQDFRWNNTHHGEIHKGDSLFTGPASDVTIQLNDKSVVHIEENSLIVFNMTGDQLSFVLKQGHVEGNLDSIKIQEVNGKPKPADTKIVTQRPLITMPKPYEKREIQIGPDGSWSGKPIAEIHWTYDKPKAKFQMQISSDPGFENIENTVITQERTAMSPELKAGPHFIRIREMDEKNNRSSWSKVAQFEVVFASPKLNLSLLAPQYKRESIAQAINDQKPISIEWYPVSGAQNYMVELSSDATMKTPKLVTTDKTQILISDYKPGKIFFRVTAMSPIKEMGPQGKVGIAVIGVNAPNIFNVADQEHLAKSAEDLPPVKDFKTRWSPVPTVSTYRLELSEFSDFSNATKTDVAGTQLTNKISKPGKYYWRVRALDKQGAPLSGYSDPGSFAYNFGQPLTAPSLKEPAENMTLFFQQNMETPFYMTWAKPDVPGVYVLQIAKDDQFKAVVFTHNTKNTKILISDKIPRGNLFWRVKVVSGERESGWSPVRKLTVLSGRAATGK